MQRLGACLPSLVFIARGLWPATSGVGAGTAFPGPSKYHDVASCVDLTIIACNGKFLR